MPDKPKIYFTSNVFTPSEIGSNEKIDKRIRDKLQILWDKLSIIAELKVFNGRFPNKIELKNDIYKFNPNIVCCHLSHRITSDLLLYPNIFAICTATAGYDHIERSNKDNILITHTPGVLHNTVADYTIALIMANLRNLIDLHSYVWNENWSSKDKWDLDQNLSSAIDNKIVGIIGLGEIGTELAKRLLQWGLEILYYDIKRNKEFEKKHSNLKFREHIEDIFEEADIVSIHIPLDKYTENLIDKDLLKRMKENALLINTSRGGVLNLKHLIELLENEDNTINFALDVFPQEPIDNKILKRIKELKANRPNIRMILMPHNASADADTRGKMDILFLTDIIKLIESSKVEDIQDCNLIPEHRRVLLERNWRIFEYWDKK